MTDKEQKVIDSLKSIMMESYGSQIEGYFGAIENEISKLIDGFAKDVFYKLNLETEKNMEIIKDNQISGKVAVQPVTVKVLLLSDKAQAPTKKNPTDSGWDIYADLSRPLLKTNNLVITTTEPDGTLTVFMNPGALAVISSGFKVELSGNPTKVYEAQVRPRSGMASNGLTVNNAPGTVDYGFRGEVGVILINHSNEIQQVHHGDRIAQMVIAEVLPTVVETVAFVSDTQRGEAGFGDSGK